jgi:hypothetical protein
MDGLSAMEHNYMSFRARWTAGVMLAFIRLANVIASGAVFYDIKCLLI